MFINNKNQLVVFADNFYGQLGLGHIKKYKIPEILPNLNIKAVSRSIGHTLFLTTEGEIYSCGYNKYGQLGLGHNNNVSIPTKIALEVENAVRLLEVKIIHICCGDNYSMCIDENYNTYAFGNNNYMQLGLGHSDRVSIPIKCNIQAIKIFCGDCYTFIIDINNQIYACGFNKSGQLGLGHNKNVDLWTELKFNHKIKDIACGIGHTLILTTKGNVYSFGYNENGQLGLGDIESKYKPEKINIQNIVKVSCGCEHNLLLDCDGNVYSFGHNGWGQLGLNNKVKVNIPTKIKLSIGDTTQKLCSIGDTTQRATKFAFAPVMDIFCYQDCSFIHDGQNIYCFGYNERYELGLGHRDEIIIPTLNPYLTDISHFCNIDNKRFMNTKSSRNVFNDMATL